MLRSFLIGAITGGALVWIWRDRLRESLARLTSEVRTRAAQGLQSIERTADRAFDGAAAPLRRAEATLEETKATVAEALRAGQEAIQPRPDERRE